MIEEFLCVKFFKFFIQENYWGGIIISLLDALKSVIMFILYHTPLSAVSQKNLL